MELHSESICYRDLQRVHGEVGAEMSLLLPAPLPEMWECFRPHSTPGPAPSSFLLLARLSCQNHRPWDISFLLSMGNSQFCREIPPLNHSWNARALFHDKSHCGVNGCNVYSGCSQFQPIPVIFLPREGGKKHSVFVGQMLKWPFRVIPQALEAARILLPAN